MAGARSASFADLSCRQAAWLCRQFRHVSKSNDPLHVSCAWAVRRKLAMDPGDLGGVLSLAPNKGFRDLFHGSGMPNPRLQSVWCPGSTLGRFCSRGSIHKAPGCCEDRWDSPTLYILLPCRCTANKIHSCIWALLTRSQRLQP